LTVAQATEKVSYHASGSSDLRTFDHDKLEAGRLRPMDMNWRFRRSSDAYGFGFTAEK